MKADKIVDVCIYEFITRTGFDYVWHMCDRDIREDIKSELLKHVVRILYEEEND